MKTDYLKHPLEKKLKTMIQQDSFLFDKVTNEQIAGMLFQDLSKPDVEWISPAFWRSLGMNPAVKKHLATEWQAHLYEADRQLISKAGNHADSILLRFYRQDRTLSWFKCHIHIYDEAQKSSPGYRLILLIKSTVHDEKNSIPMVSDIGIISTPFKSDEAIFHMDQTLCIQKMNPTGEKLTGKMESEARGKPLDTILTLLDDSSGETVALPVDFYLYEHQSRMQKLSLSAVSKENIKHPVSVFGSQIWDESGDPKGSILILKIKSRKDLFQYLILSRYSLIRYAKNHRLDELLKKALDELGEIVNSPIGFYHFVSPDQKTLVLQQWSSRTLDEFCNINGGDMHYSIDKAGVWVDCVHQKKPVIHNNYASLENKKGLPQNHAPVTRELVVPVIRDGNVVAVLGVGNKPVYYNSEDAEIVSYFADVTWEIVRQKQVEEQIALQKNIDQELADLSTLLLTQTTLEEISENVLETAKKLTKSRYGYVGTYDSEKKFLINHTMTRDIWEKCDVPNKSIVFEKCTGLFGWVIDNQQPLMLNSINADDPRSCGTPEGHIKIEAFLCVPAMIDGELAGQIALANPENQYLDIDLKIVQRLANLFALAIQRQNYHDHLLEMESRKAKDLEKTVEQRTRELMASRNLLEKIFTSQLDAILVLDTATPPCIIDANPSTIRMFGYSKTDLIGQTTALFHSSTDKNALFWETIAAHVERDREFYLDSHDLQKKNGSMLSVRVSATRMRGSGNGITGWVLVIHDNSEEKRYQDSLKRNEEKFRAIADYTLDWEGWLDPEGRFLWLNPAAEKITGYTIQDYMSARNLEDWISMLFIAGYSEEAAAVFHQVLRHKESVNDRHFKIRKKDGEDCWISLSCRPIYSGSGIYFGIRTSIRDITERKKVERQVFLSQQRLQLAMESIRDGVWDWRLDTGEVYFSSRWYTMLGYDPNEMPPSYDTWKQLTHPEDIDTCEQIIRSALESGNPFEMEFRMRTREGQWKWILARGRAFEKDTQGKPLRMLGTHMDMTQRKLMESNMRQSQKMEAMGTLAGGIAHDFNNILAGIIGYAELVLDEVDPDSRAFTRLNGIINSSERARELISQILTFSRKEEKEIQPVDIRLITREALKLIRASLPSTIAIEQDIQPNLPFVMGDPTQIHQVIMNLSTNALHAMADGGLLKISLKKTRLDESFCQNHLDLKPGYYIRLKVSDNGCGIQPDILPRVFDPFFTTKPKDKGTGLGLSVVHGIVKNLGGDIHFKSMVDHGTDVFVYMQAHELVKPIIKNNKPEIFRGAENILLVDDEDVLSVVMQDMLEELGYNVTALTDSVEAYHRFSLTPKHWDIVLSDITMPEMTGIELARSIKRICPEMPIILWSGDNKKMPEDLMAPSQYVRFLKKPFRQEELSRTIRECLEKL